MVSNDVASSGLDQSTNHRDNIYGKENYYSKSYETHQKNNCCSSSYGDTITTLTKTLLSKLTPPGKEYMCFQIEGESAHS